MRGPGAGWAPLPVQYADYALWQRELLGTEDDPGSLLSRQVGYWREALDGAPPELAPARRPAAPGGGQPPRALGAAGRPGRGAPAAGGAGAGEGVTVFMVVQAALAVLLSRLGAGTDIPLGAAVAGRTDEALDDLVGFFVNTLVLRTDLSGDPDSPGAAGAGAASALAGALDHQDVPFERLVEVLAPARSLARHPLFQVLLTVQNNAPAGWSCRACGRGDAGRRPAAARFDLDVIVAETCGARAGRAGCGASVIAAADLFDAPTAAAIAQRLVRVLEAVAADPGTPAAAGRRAGAGEREQVLHGVE